MCKVMTQAASQQSVLMTLLVSQRPVVLTEVVVAHAALRAGRPGPGLRRLRPGGLGAAVWRGLRRLWIFGWVIGVQRPIALETKP